MPEAKPVWRERSLLSTFLSVLVHELTHGVVFLGDPGLARSRDAASHLWDRGDRFDWLLRANVEAVAAYTLAFHDGSNEAPPWRDHELQFTRAHAHLVHRAAAAGLHLEQGEQLAGDDFGLSPMWAYNAVLAAEVQEKADESLLEVLATPAPAAAEALFAADVHRWGAAHAG